MGERHDAESGPHDQWILDTVDKYQISPDCSKEEFIAVVKRYARKVTDEFSLSVSVTELDWEVSVRAKRRAGAVKHRDGTPESVSLTWEYFEQKGWEAIAETIRHELIHVHLLNEAQDAGHGPPFRELAQDLNTRIRCSRFAEPNWWVVCDSCGDRVARYRRSPLIDDPDQYRCGSCGGALLVKSNS